MFGFTKLTPEEKTAYEVKKRILELEALLQKEGEVRQASLDKAEVYNKELSRIKG